MATKEKTAIEDYKAAQKALADAGKKVIGPLVTQLTAVAEEAKALEKDGIDLKELKAAVKKLNTKLNGASGSTETWWDATAVDAHVAAHANNKATKKARSEMESGLCNGKKFNQKSWAVYAQAKLNSDGAAASKKYWKK